MPESSGGLDEPTCRLSQISMVEVVLHPPIAPLAPDSSYGANRPATANRGISTWMNHPTSNWADEYATRTLLYVALEQEVLFALNAEVERVGIKLHSLTSRVKTLDSLKDKAARKGYESPLVDAPDIVV